MPVSVKREDLLQQLIAVQPGLSQRDIIEQSSYFIFRDNEVITFNGEIACRQKTSLDTIKGAVQASPLVELLQKLGEDEIEIDTDESEFKVRGKGRRAGIRMEKEIILPYDKVDYPTSWKRLPEDFKDAITIARECAGRDASSFALTCVHIAAKWIESCDNVQLTRYNIDTGVTDNALVRATSIAHLIQLELTKFGETEQWIHFKGPSGLIISCRRYKEQYLPLDRELEVKGQVVSLPKGLAEAAEKAEIFSAEQEVNEVLVEIRPGKVRVKGSSISGWYSESKELNYDGDPISFHLSPKLLGELVRRHNECEISGDKLKVDGGKFVYVSCLGKVEDKNGED